MEQIFRYTIFAVYLGVLAACTQNEFAEPAPDARRPLAITVADAGYLSEYGVAPASTDAPVTRIAEDGYVTKFEGKETCGLFAVKDGRVEVANIKLTATVNQETQEVTWMPEGELWYTAGTAYYLYYPWQESPNGTPAAGEDAYATDDAGFFETMISQWSPATDQSTYEAYTASDLMTAMAKIETAGAYAKLSFTMKHRMGLAVVQLPAPEKDQTEAPGFVPTVTFEDSALPYFFATDVCRYLFNPAAGAKLSGSYEKGGMNYTFSIEMKANELTGGSYNTYVVSDARGTM